MPSLLIATRNAHKTAEIRSMLGAGWDVADLTTRSDFPDVEETGQTFRENAELKALSASFRDPGSWVLADDSGLEVDALDGAPGVISARYSGVDATDATNRAKLLAALAEVESARRTARFHCAMSLAHGGVVEGAFDGAVEGRILREERGQGGFGYDALFVPSGFEDTFAELPVAVKNSLSHRGRALAKAITFLRARG